MWSSEKEVDESFAYGRYYMVTDFLENRGQNFIRILRLKRRKKKLYLDAKDGYWSPQKGHRIGDVFFISHGESEVIDGKVTHPMEQVHSMIPREKAEKITVKQQIKLLKRRGIVWDH